MTANRFWSWRLSQRNAAVRQCIARITLLDLLLCMGGSAVMSARLLESTGVDSAAGTGAVSLLAVSYLIILAAVLKFVALVLPVAWLLSKCLESW